MQRKLPTVSLPNKENQERDWQITKHFLLIPISLPKGFSFHEHELKRKCLYECVLCFLLNWTHMKNVPRCCSPLSRSVELGKEIEPSLELWIFHVYIYTHVRGESIEDARGRRHRTASTSQEYIFVRKD